MNLDLLLNLLGTTIDIVLLFYFTRNSDLHCSYIHSTLLYGFLWLSVIFLNLHSFPFIFKVIYEVSAILLLNKYLYSDFTFISNLKSILLFYLSLCICELLSVGISFVFFHFSSLQELFANKLISMELIIFTKMLSFIVLYIVFRFGQNNIFTYTKFEITLYFLPIITNIFLIFAIIYILKTTQHNFPPEYGQTLSLISIVCLISSFCHFILFDLYISKKVTKDYITFVENQEKKAYDYYQKRLEDSKNLSILRHDLKNQLLALKYSTNELSQNHIDSLLTQIPNSTYDIHTGNPFIDVLVSEKISHAQAQNIKCDICINLKNISFISNMDFCSLFGNLLDNCIESVTDLDAEKYIFIRCDISKQYLLIKAMNPYKKKLKFKNGIFLTTKSNTSHHGFGITSIKNIVKKYNGNASFSTQNNIFTASISIPIPSGTETNDL